MIRPERTRILGPNDGVPDGANVVDAAVGDVLYLGSDRKYGLTLADGQRAAVREQRDGDERVWATGDAVRLAWATEDGVLVADTSDQ